MKIFSAKQTRQIDEYTILHEPIASIDLMERASRVFVEFFTGKIPSPQKLTIFAGPGNNGGDALAIARMLLEKAYLVQVFLCRIGSELSPDCMTNLNRLKAIGNASILEIRKNDPLPEIQGDLVIDGIFGSGLNRAVEGYWARLISHINEGKKVAFAIDIPSGTFADRHTGSISIYARYTLSFEFAKLAFLFPENFQRVGQWEYRSIGLNKEIQVELKTKNFMVDEDYAAKLLRVREKFQHKGNFGHLCLVGGSYGKSGAMTLAGHAALRSGIGLLSYQVPGECYVPIQSSVPEAMIYKTSGKHFLREIENDSLFTSFGIGCGMGLKTQTQSALLELLKSLISPVVLDADALNILAENPGWLEILPPDSILTPHPKEFERLFGKTSDQFKRLEVQRQKSMDLAVHIVLKGMHSCITDPAGNAYFNSTGNPGMATAGSGDVLTGILSSLLCQGYPAVEACVLGVYLHGLAGDIAADELGQNSLMASDIIRYLPQAFLRVSHDFGH